MMLRDLLHKVNIVSCSADMDIEIDGVSYDTRTLGAGDLFVAISGYKHDGHKYIEEAVRKGAACVICEKAPSVEVPYISVDDSRKALACVSAAWFGYPAKRLKIVGITGTNGKTTVSTMIKRVVEYCGGGKAGLIGTIGNMIGERELSTEHTTPESYEIQKLLAMMCEEGCEYVVMEVSSHALALSRVYGIQFEVGVFTNLSPDHLDFHDSMENYAYAKAALFSNCRRAVINIDDENAQLMIENATGYVFRFSTIDTSANLFGKSIKLQSDRVEFTAVTNGSQNRVELRIPGIFTVYNALAVMSAMMSLGFDIDIVAPALQISESVKGRAEIVPTGTDYTVLIDYAHTPDALFNIITAVRECTLGRVVTLFGCGGDRDRKKRPLMGDIAAKHSDFVVVTSDNPRTEEPCTIIAEILSGMKNTQTPYKVIENRYDAIHWALENSQPDDVLILAGKGHESYQIFGSEKRHFDEREVVSEYYDRL